MSHYCETVRYDDCRCYDWQIRLNNIPRLRIIFFVPFIVASADFRLHTFLYAYTHKWKIYSFCLILLVGMKRATASLTFSLLSLKASITYSCQEIIFKSFQFKSHIWINKHLIQWNNCSVWQLMRNNVQRFDEVPNEMYI